MHAHCKLKSEILTSYKQIKSILPYSEKKNSNSLWTLYFRTGSTSLLTYYDVKTIRNYQGPYQLPTFLNHPTPPARIKSLTESAHDQKQRKCYRDIFQCDLLELYFLYPKFLIDKICPLAQPLVEWGF